MTEIDGKLIGRLKDVIDYYHKTRGKWILPTRVRFYHRKGLLEGCIEGRSKGGHFYFDLRKTALRLDRIFAYKEFNRMSLAEIRLAIVGKMKDEDFIIQRKGEV
jgi:DNA-binding transcriptional MerR regulator